MKKIALFLIVVVFGYKGAAQIPFSDSLAESYPIYRELMGGTDATFEDIQRAFQLYSSKNPGMYKQYYRWESMAMKRIRPDGKVATHADIAASYNRFKANNVASRSASSNWTLTGPITMPVNIPSQPNGLGRINEIAFDANQPNTIYVGAPAGGLWKSVDGGASWESHTDNLPSLGVSAIVVDKDNSDIVYIGTGDRDHSSSDGVGIMKSTDGGVSFVSLPDVPSIKINDIIQDPVSGVLIAAAYGRVYRSTDSGNSWTAHSLPNNAGNILNILFHPTNPNIVYASTAGGYFYKSIDNGTQWTHIESITGNTGRAFIAVTPAAPNNVYFVRANFSVYEGLWRSTDSGDSFVQMSNTPNILGYYDGDGNGGQGWYDLAICADPNTADLIYVGGVNIWESSDGGTNWTKKTTWYSDVHADQHHLVFAPNGNCYAANDGGIYYSSDGWETQTEITNGLAIAQIYRVGQSKNIRDLVMTGFQDNGTGLLDGNNWITVYGGDGMECAISSANDNIRYLELYQGQIQRQMPDQTWYYSIFSQEGGPWVTPFEFHPRNPNIMLVGANSNLWRSMNSDAPSTDDVTWVSVLSTDAGGLDIAFSPQNPETVYYATRSGDLLRCDNITSSSLSWTTLTLPSNSFRVNTIICHPTNENIVYIGTASGRVYKSDDKGDSWIDISGSIAGVHPYCLAYDYTTDEGLYVGTPAGVYYRDPDTDDWVLFSSGLPVNVPVRELEIYYDENNPANSVLRAATYGRGLWSSPLASAPLPVELVSFSGKKNSHHSVLLQWSTASEINNDHFVVARSGDGVRFEEIGTVAGNGTTSEAHQYQLLDTDPLPGINYYQLIQQDFDGNHNKHNIVAVSFSVDGYKGVEVYPNPSKGMFTVFINQQYIGDFDVSVYNTSGRLVYSKNGIPNGRHAIDLTDLPKGIYYLEVKNDDILNTQKLVIE